MNGTLHEINEFDFMTSNLALIYIYLYFIFTTEANVYALFMNIV